MGDLGGPPLLSEKCVPSASDSAARTMSKTLMCRVGGWCAPGEIRELGAIRYKCRMVCNRFMVMGQFYFVLRWHRAG